MHNPIRFLETVSEVTSHRNGMENKPKIYTLDLDDGSVKEKGKGIPRLSDHVKYNKELLPVRPILERLRRAFTANGKRQIRVYVSSK